MLQCFFNKYLNFFTGIWFCFFSLSLLGIDDLGTWEEKNPDLSTTENFDIYGMAYGNNKFVIVGQDVAANKAFTANSPDGKQWTIRSSGSSSEVFNSVIFSNNRFIAVCKQPESGNGRIWISDDNGNKWKAMNSDNEGLIVSGGLHAIASNGSGKLVAVGGDPSGNGWITVSNDNGDTWRVVRDGASYKAFTGKFYGVGYGKNYWYALTTSRTYGSADAATWTDIGGPGVDDLGYKVASDDTTVVVASSSGPQWTTDNGTTWNNGEIASGFTATPALTSAASSVVYAEGLFVLATRDAGDVWVSETGRYWKRWKLPSTNKTYALCHANKSFWCGGWYERLSRSPSWFKSRTGSSADYPFTLFDTEDAPPNRIGLPQYRVNTASLNLILEATLFYTQTLASPINFKLVYCSQPWITGDPVGLFGKNWRLRYESNVGSFGQEAVVFSGGGRSHTFTTPNGEDLSTVTSDVALNNPDGIFDKLDFIYNGGTSRFELTLKNSHLTYVYGTAGNGPDNTGLFYLSAIKDQFGNQTNITVTTANGQITAITDPAARNFTFTYDGATGLCTNITMSDGRTVTFNYDADKNLTNIQDMMGYTGTYAYDTASFLTSMTTGTKTTTFTYEERPGYETGTVEIPGDKYLSSITRADGEKIKYELLEDGKKVQRTDSSGQVSIISNNNGQTTGIRDPFGNVKSYVYNSSLLPSTVTDESGGVYKYEYDTNGNMTKMTDALGNETTYTYDANNNMTKKTNALGQEWTYQYSNYLPSQTTTPLGNITQLAYFGNGRLQTLTDARNNATAFVYDANGNITNINPPTGGGIVLGYDAKGFRCTQLTDGNGKTKTIAWDNNDRITGVTYTSVAGSPSYANAYDEFGQNKFTDELGSVTNIVRDELGFVTSVTDPLSYVTQTKYDADNRPIKTTDPLGRTVSTTYDNSGRPILFTDAKGYRISKTYDGKGNLISFKDKNGTETKFTYDKNNRLITTTDPLKKITTVTRDALGRVSTTTNARKQIITNTYDDDGRLIKQDVQSSAKAASATLFSYVRDANGNITSQTDDWGTTTYTYDANNRLLTITYPDSKVVTLTYNNGGDIASITYPDGLIATYTYDDFNRMQIPSLLKNNPGTELIGESRSTNAIVGIALSGAATGNFTFTYNNRGQISSLVRPNNTKSDYTYDAAGRFTSIIHSSTGGVANVDLSATYSLDAVGNVSSEDLTGSSYYQSTQTIENILLSYKSGQLTKKGKLGCKSDADGNIIDFGSKSIAFTFDALNRITKMVKKDGTVINNTFNPAGLRVKKETVNGETLLYHYLPSGILLFTTNSTSGETVDNIVSGNTLLASYNISSGEILHHYGDRQAHVRFVADENGTVKAKYDYLPYGQVDPDPTNAVVGNSYTFNGILGVMDEGGGLFYMQQRFYDTASGRFLSRDPLGFDAGSNLYAFAGSNPLMFADPTGKMPVILAVGLFLIAAKGAHSAIVYLGEKAKGFVEKNQKDDEEYKNNKEAWLNKQGREENEKRAADMEDLAVTGGKTILKLENFRQSPISTNFTEATVDQVRGKLVDNATAEPDDAAPEEKSSGSWFSW